MKRITKFLIFISIFTMLLLPVLSFAQVNPPPLNSLVPCSNTPDPTTGIIPDASKCGFNQLMDMVNNVIKFFLFDMAIPIAAIMFFFAGFELVTSGGSTEKRGLAKKVFTNAVLGLIIAMAAWLIIRTLLSILGYEGAWIGF